jgi:hypothetical protein
MAAELSDAYIYGPKSGSNSIRHYEFGNIGHSAEDRQLVTVTPGALSRRKSKIYGNMGYEAASIGESMCVR